MTMQASQWIGGPNIPVVSVRPMVLFGSVALTLGVSASGFVPPGEAGLPVSNDWLLGSMYRVGWDITCDNSGGGSLEILVSGDSGTATFRLWQAFALTGSANVNTMVEVLVPGWMAQFRIVNGATAGVSYAGCIFAKAVA